MNYDVLSMLQMPRSFRTVDGVITENTSEKTKKDMSKLFQMKMAEENLAGRPPRPVSLNGAKADWVLKSLQMPRSFRMVDDVIMEDIRALHVSTSDSDLSKLALPCRVHSLQQRCR